jgi:hypothetical protein
VQGLSLAGYGFLMCVCVLPCLLQFFVASPDCVFPLAHTHTHTHTKPCFPLVKCIPLLFFLWKAEAKTSRCQDIGRNRHRSCSIDVDCSRRLSA